MLHLADGTDHSQYVRHAGSADERAKAQLQEEKTPALI
jgi:hypothetical protein